MNFEEFQEAYGPCEFGPDPHEGEPYCLYRWFDRDWRLLRVGYAVNSWESRTSVYQAARDLLAEAVCAGFTFYPDLPSVQQAERDAIRDEHPLAQW